MKRFHPSWAAAAVAALLVACSGGGEGDQAPRVHYGKMVTFGDSLSDIGSYGVGIVAAFSGGAGGHYTINGTDESLNWTERLAATLGLTALCPAQTGLNTSKAATGFDPVPVVNHEGCYSYAQGGSRVTELWGPGNINLLINFGDTGGALGQLTDPVVNQIGRHLDAAGGTFAADDLVTVMAGGNDLFMTIPFVFQGTLAATGDLDQAKAAANAAMAAAGTQLAGYVKDLIVAKGAQRVVVVNLPDVSSTPAFLGADADNGTEADDFVTRALVLGLVQSFNGALATGLKDTGDHVLQVDAFTVGQDQTAHPTQYGLTNVTTPACDIGPTGALAALPTSLVCTDSTLVVPAAQAATFQYADGVHPTPYGYKLLSQLVTQEMAKKGWL